MYSIEFSPQAMQDVADMSKSSPKDFVKVSKFIEEIKEHPLTGTGHHEPMKGGDGNVYSRRINKKDILWYHIYDDKVFVLIASAKGHYNDK